MVLELRSTYLPSAATDTDTANNPATLPVQGQGAAGSSMGVVHTLSQITPPHAIEVEQALLGALLYNNKALDDLQGRLLPVHFYVPFHAQLFGTIDRLINKGFEAAPLTVRDALKNTPFAAEVDLLKHLTAMLENAAYHQDVMALAEIIHTHYLQRELLKVGGKLQQEAGKAPPQEETAALLDAASSELFALAESGTSANTVKTMREPLKAVLAQAEAIKARGGKLAGIPSGFTDLDEKIGGLQSSDLIILAARPSMGKTALALNIASNIARKAYQGNPDAVGVGFFSLEMSADQLASRILCSMSGINSHKLQTGNLQEGEFGRLVQVSNELADYPLYIDDTPQMTINALRARARRMKRQYNIGVLMVDYLSLLSGGGKYGDNRVQEITQISLGLKAVARELNIPVVALSQLSRAVEQRDNKRPQLSDLRESGSIEQDADIVMFLYREEYYLEKQLGVTESYEGEQTQVSAEVMEKEQAKIRERLEKVRGRAEVIISKNRKGATGAIALQWQGDITTFHNYTPRH